ncbi:MULTISPECIES: hypothetical protein [Amycolatopsis]|uniref:Uncharacterized protein n=2 Tax=Amycolatopsis TaxID=1813 RepID=A0A558AEI9_9PSEU|nr:MULTISPECIES: hypothetical protein [Amycolatopsis]MBB2506111.1 hypothetical protein [Amycolatopsis echigonensis]TVT22633.1 hypothetical protein FNH06_12335 [Amycolatopsis acidiphila]UIJ59617.1 hypothetical protein LWP59_37295 [Amycolatopsis acidiphila]
MGTGHAAWASTGSAPHVHTVAGVGAADEVVARRRAGADAPSGREVARVGRAPAAVVRERAPG